MTDENINVNNSSENEEEKETEQTEVSAEQTVPAEEPQQVEPAAEPTQTAEPSYVYYWNGSAEPQSEKKGKKKNNGAKTFAIVMSVAFAIALLALASVLVFLPGSTAGNYGELSVRELAEIGKPYTVAIEVSGNSSVDKSFFSGIGSGFFMTENGYIITNYHVVEDATSIVVYTYNDGGEPNTYSGSFVGGDKTLDVALIRINPNGNEKFPVAPLGNSDEVHTGDPVVAIGTPDDLDYAWTVTKGYVTCENRITDNFSTGAQSFIQTDASLNPGNSGGPLINGRGEVIGIIRSRVVQTVNIYDESGNVTGYTIVPADGMGFAIPINQVVRLCESYMENDMKKPILGIKGHDVTEGYMYLVEDTTMTRVFEDGNGGYIYYELINGVVTSQTVTASRIAAGTLFTAAADGFWINSVDTDSGAYGKLKRGDIITSFDGTQLSMADGDGDGIVDKSPLNAVKEMLADKTAGDVVEVKYIRDGAEQSVNIRLSHKQ